MWHIMILIGQIYLFNNVMLLKCQMYLLGLSLKVLKLYKYELYNVKY